MPKQSSTIKIFLVNGNPEGLRTAEISNWTGKALACPRSELFDLYQRPEINSQGIYILYGIDPETDENTIYIGEAEDVKSRLRQHRSKDYWNSVVIFTSKDDNLTKAHVKYLETSLIDRALELSKAKIMNRNTTITRLPETDEADMDVYLNNIYKLLPILGINSFSKAISNNQKKIDLLVCSIKGLIARGMRTSKGFVVLKNSQAVIEHRPSAKSIKKLRERLKKERVLIPKDGYLLFSRDYEFGSPSTAGGVVRGGNTNGLKAWKNNEGTPLVELEQI